MRSFVDNCNRDLFDAATLKGRHIDNVGTNISVIETSASRDQSELRKVLLDPIKSPGVCLLDQVQSGPNLGKELLGTCFP